MIFNERWFNKVRNYIILSFFPFSLFPFWGVFFGCPQTWPPCQYLFLIHPISNRTCESHVKWLIPKSPNLVIFVRTDFRNFCLHGGLGWTFCWFLSAQYIRHIYKQYSIFFTAQGSQSRKHVRVSSIYWSLSSVSISASSSPFFFFPTNAIITFLISAWWLQCFEYIVVFFC